MGGGGGINSKLALLAPHIPFNWELWTFEKSPPLVKWYGWSTILGRVPKIPQLAGARLDWGGERREGEKKNWFLRVSSVDIQIEGAEVNGVWFYKVMQRAVITNKRFWQTRLQTAGGKCISPNMVYITKLETIGGVYNNVESVTWKSPPQKLEV